MNGVDVCAREQASLGVCLGVLLSECVCVRERDWKMLQMILLRIFISVCLCAWY